MLLFNPSPEMSLGVEIEVQLIDRTTRDLTPRAPDILQLLGEPADRVKPEIFRGMLEISTGVCDGIAQARADVYQTVSALQRVCDSLGVDLASAGSHPFARYRDRVLFPANRYKDILRSKRWMAKRLMIFGLHVHIGMRDGQHAVAMLNAIAPYLPYALALSASSPYWQGNDTGLASSRITIFEAMPNAGHPCLFRDWAEFHSFYESAHRSGSIRSVKDIWWDVRLQPDLGTMEIRICDGLPSVREAMNLVAFLYSLVHWLDSRYLDGERFLPPSFWIMRENKWRASRWGVDAQIVMNEGGTTSPLRIELERLLYVLQPYAARLQCGSELADLAGSADVGLSYERQRRAFKESGDLRVVIDNLVEEFRAGLPLATGS